MPQAEIPRIPPGRSHYGGNRQFDLYFHRYRASKDGWKHISPDRDYSEDVLPDQFKLVAWNVQFKNNFPDLRLQTALDYLQRKILDCSDDEEPAPCVVLLQEVHTRALDVLLGNKWIRRYFYITPKNAERFALKTCFGNMTLVSRQLGVATARSLEFTYVSDQERSALMTEVKVGTKSEEVVTLRIVNVHLESYLDGLKHRGDQIALIKRMVIERKDGEEVPHGIILAGAFNAASEWDSRMLEEHGLRDAWKGDDEDEESFTWGFQGGRAANNPPGRLDRIMFVPNNGLQISTPVRVGIGLRRPDVDKWVSDHYGLVSQVRIL